MNTPHSCPPSRRCVCTSNGHVNTIFIILNHHPYLFSYTSTSFTSPLISPQLKHTSSSLNPHSHSNHCTLTSFHPSQLSQHHHRQPTQQSNTHYSLLLHHYRPTNPTFLTSSKQPPKINLNTLHHLSHKQIPTNL